MPQHIPFPPVSQERSIYVKYHKVSGRANNKVRSGILERHTYKSDNGKLISSNPKPSNKTRSTSLFRRNSNNLNTSKTTIIKTNLNKNQESRVLSQNVTFLKLGNSSREDEKVRTEHCDSTTDITENMEKNKKIDFRNQYLEYRKTSLTGNSFKKYSEQSCEVDSDSDCQIIDVNLSSSEGSHISDKKDRYPVSQDEILTQNTDKTPVIIDNCSDNEESPNSKVLSWISKEIDPSNLSPIQVISDSEEEDRGTFITGRTACIAKINEKVRISPKFGKVIPDITISHVNVPSKVPVLINANFNSIKRNHTSGFTDLSHHNKTPDLCSAQKFLHITSPKVIMNRLESTPSKLQKLNLQIQKGYAQLSPESMKSEFYSYLKINTNPLAQKVENTMKNRRSVRVKNIISQIEKDKELKKNVTPEKVKNDVRKKFMKFAKTNTIFPEFPNQQNKISDFNHSIEAYFSKENIKHPKLKSSDPKEEKRNKDEINKSVDKTRKKYLSKARKKQLQTKDRNLSFLTDQKIRRLRFRPNRINSSIRITRNSLDGYRTWSKKMLKTKKPKINKNIDKKSVKPVEKSDKNNSPNTTNESIERILNDFSVELEEIDKIGTTKTDLKNSEKARQNKCLDKQKSAKTIEKSDKSNSPNTTNESVVQILNDFSVELEEIDEIGTSKTDYKNAEKLTPNSLDLGDKTPDFSPYVPMLGSDIDKKINLYCQNTPIYNSESERELEFFTSSSHDTKVQQNEKSSDKANSFHRNKSPPFLGFTTDENTAQQNFITTVKTLSKFEHNLQSRPEIRQSEEVISICSDGNTALEDEDSNSERFSETSSVQEDNQMNVQEVVDTDLIESGNPSYIPLNQNIKPRSFHKSLTQTCVKRKSMGEATRTSLFELSDSDSSMSTPKTPKGAGRKSQTHEIDINKNNGAVFNTYYVNEILIIVQELLITFWKQTALGNILGAQNMWLPHGSIQRIILEPGCVNRRSSEMVLSCDNSVAYIELWTKEHKCRFRECPIADVFATIYYHKGHGSPDKRVLQLEKIKGYGSDVRFAVIKNSREIIVSWCDTFAKPIKTLVRSYQLASDFQTVSSIKEMEFVSHYISSLHNINDCDDLVLGAGDEQISVWNLRHGYLVTTLNLSESPLQSPSEHKTICLYAQCDTGFLFLIQQTEVGILRLVAVNGMTQEWKQLHSYQVPDNYKKLLGVIVESGVLMTCYTNGFLCWNMHSGEVLAEIDTPNELIVLPSNKYMVAIDNYQVTVQHIMSYILTHDW